MIVIILATGVLRLYRLADYPQFFNQDHTIMARYMMQYPYAYAGPVPGTYFVGSGNIRRHRRGETYGASRPGEKRLGR